MTPYASKSILVISFTVICVLSMFYPNVLAKNEFLIMFVGYDFLSFLGIVLSISIASLLQLSLSVSKDSRLDRDATKFVIDELRSTSIWMVGIFSSGLCLVFLRPFAAAFPHWLSLINGLAVFLIIFYLVMLLDTILATFDLHSEG